MTLNSGQNTAATAVFQFLMSDDKEFRLSGPAGVGKTYMLQHIMQTVMQEYQDACKLLDIAPKITTIDLTATTNKAAEVLRTSSGFPTSTIHSFLNLRVYDDYNTGKSKINKTGAWVVHSNVLIFVDEASMVDTPLHRLLLEGTDNTCKIVYVGDHCQMAPVFESISPIYKDRSTNFVELIEPVRNADQPALMNLCSQLRDTVKTGIFKPIVSVKGVIDYIDDTELQNILDTQFIDEHVDGRVLCFTNYRVHEYNDYIRDIRGYGADFTEGEVLISNSAYLHNNKPSLSVEQEVEVFSVEGDPYMKTISTDNTKMEVYKLQLNNINGIIVEIPKDKQHYNELLKYYKGRKDWSVFYHLKNNYPDLRQKDAATVYKAQGSTYDFVILDLTNIGTCRKPDQVARMLYVGASRPKTRIYLYGQLPERYRGV